MEEASEVSADQGGDERWRTVCCACDERAADHGELVRCAERGATRRRRRRSATLSRRFTSVAQLCSPLSQACSSSRALS